MTGPGGRRGRAGVPGQQRAAQRGRRLGAGPAGSPFPAYAPIAADVKLGVARNWLYRRACALPRRWHRPAWPPARPCRGRRWRPPEPPASDVVGRNAAKRSVQRQHAAPAGLLRIRPGHRGSGLSGPRAWPASRSCVTITTERRPGSARLDKATISALFVDSRLPVGSSQSRIRPRHQTAATATRCISPPDICSGKRRPDLAGRHAPGRRSPPRGPRAATAAVACAAVARAAREAAPFGLERVGLQDRAEHFPNRCPAAKCSGWPWPAPRDGARDPALR